VVHVYAMEPPVHAATMLDIRRRLAIKLAAAREVFGTVMTNLGIDPSEIRSAASIIPPVLEGKSPSDPVCVAAPPDAAERTEEILCRWRNGGGAERNGVLASNGATVIAAARGVERSWLAFVDSDQPRLIASRGEAISDAPAFVLDVCRLVDATTPDAALADATDGALTVATALEQLARWLDIRRGAELAGVADIPAVRARRSTLAAIARLADAPASVRATLTESAGRALAVAAGSLGAASEQHLRDMNSETSRISTDWLSEVAAIPLSGGQGRRRHGATLIRALIIIKPAR
jgi:hypothetical protein